MPKRTAWFASDVRRPNAGFLYNAVRWIDGARIEDAAVFTRPWTLAFPLMRDDEYRIYEYACHEGNRAIEGVLRGARYQERAPGAQRR